MPRYAGIVRNYEYRTSPYRRLTHDLYTAWGQGARALADASDVPRRRAAIGIAHRPSPIGIHRGIALASRPDLGDRAMRGRARRVEAAGGGRGAAACRARGPPRRGFMRHERQWGRSSPPARRGRRLPLPLALVARDSYTRFIYV